MARLSKSAIDVTNQVGIDRNSAATVEEVGADPLRELRMISRSMADRSRGEKNTRLDQIELQP